MVNHYEIFCKSSWVCSLPFCPTFCPRRTGSNHGQIAEFQVHSRASTLATIRVLGRGPTSGYNLFRPGQRFDNSSVFPINVLLHLSLAHLYAMVVTDCETQPARNLSANIETGNTGDNGDAAICGNPNNAGMRVYPAVADRCHCRQAPSDGYQVQLVTSSCEKGSCWKVWSFKLWIIWRNTFPSDDIGISIRRTAYTFSK